MLVDKDLPSAEPRSPVSRDMAEIFTGRSIGGGRSRSGAHALPILSTAKPRRRMPSRSTIGLGFAIGALAVTLMLPAERSPQPVRLTPLPQAATPMPAPALPALSAPTPPTITPVAEQAIAPPPPEAGSVNLAPPVARAAAKPAVTRKARPVRARYRRALGDCAARGGMARARCLYPEIVRADDVLRDAYSDAARAGVSSRTLSIYRDRWARLRRRALSDPDMVADGYRALSRDLRDLRADVREGDGGPIGGGF